MGKTFLISGFGRSGTKFLSTIMNKSKTWTVKHEPRGVKDEQYGRLKNKNYLNEIQLNFTPNYGEVNSYLRYYFKDIVTDNKALLLRNPKKILLSVCNRKPRHTWPRYLNEIVLWYEAFYDLIEKQNVKYYIFEKMVSDVKYLQEILKDFNINDYIVTTDDITKKINPNKNVRFKNFPLEFKALVDIRMKLIVEKFKNYKKNG